MSLKHKISGFFTAIILSVLSFVAIYFFAPDFSARHFGVSFREKPAKVMLEDVKNTVTSIKKGS